MLNARKRSDSTILRIGSNCHRYLVVINGKFTSFVTHEKDFLFDVARLFGMLNRPGFWRHLTAAPYLIALAISCLLSTPVVFALPTGWLVVSGNVTFEQNGSTLNITSTTNQAIINYQAFNIGQGETVNFYMPDSASSILNRVIGSGASFIDGSLNANGQLLLVN